MPNQQLNPFTAPLSVLKQVGEQANASIQAVGTSMTQAASGTLDAFMSGLPPFPGAPTPAPAARGAPGIPALQQLMPANLQQAMSQVENLLIPPGLPRLSQMVTGRPAAPAAPPTPAAPPPAAPAAERATAARRRVHERRGM